MNIEKLKNYNQKMLAILSTILVSVAAIGLIVLLATIIIEIIPTRRHENIVLLSDEKADKLANENLRKQIISYDNPRLIDTVNLLYIIPISVKTLEKPEYIESDNSMEFMDLQSGFGSGSAYKERFFYESFNNLILYNGVSGETHKISDTRLIGSDLLCNYFENEIILTFTGAEMDNDGDDKVTLKDFKSLYVYPLTENAIRKIFLPNAPVISYEFIEGEKDILVKFGIDRDLDNTFDISYEPTLILRYNFENDTLVRIVDEHMELQIQKIIDKK